MAQADAEHLEIEVDQETYDRLIEAGEPERRAKAKAAYARKLRAAQRAQGETVNGQEVAFLILAVIGGLAGLLVVTSRNVVHAALYLVVALASVAGVYLLLAAPFVAFVQVIIYVGAIVVLILFGIMLTRAPSAAGCSTTPCGPGSAPSWSGPACSSC